MNGLGGTFCPSQHRQDIPSWNFLFCYGIAMKPSFLNKW